MDPQVTLVTLGVKDIAKSQQFYEKGLGWKASSASNESMVAFHTKGTIISLYEEKLLAEDATVEYQPASGFRGFSLAHNVETKEEVKKVLDAAVKAGAKLVKPAQDVFWGGHSGYFADPDGFLWEVAWNPHWPLDSHGNLQLP